jgi:hypothetical protein
MVLVAIDGGLNSHLFRQAMSVAPPRLMQFALKYTF